MVIIVAKTIRDAVWYCEKEVEFDPKGCVLIATEDNIPPRRWRHVDERDVHWVPGWWTGRHAEEVEAAFDSMHH